MMDARVLYAIGGPAHGQQVTVATAWRVMIPVPDGTGQFGTFSYTRRRLRDRDGEVMDILAPEGEPVDAVFLDKNCLAVEQ